VVKFSSRLSVYNLSQTVLGDIAVVIAGFLMLTAIRN